MTIYSCFYNCESCPRAGLDLRDVFVSCDGKPLAVSPEVHAAAVEIKKARASRKRNR